MKNLNLKILKKFVETTNNSEYTLLTNENEYKNSKTILKVKHSCGNIFNVETCHFISDNNRCPKCVKALYFRTKTQEEFEKDVYRAVGNEYTVIGKYVNKSTKIELLHKKCNCIYFVTPGHFLNTGCRCTNCRETSRGEGNIRNILESKNIEFIREFKFSDLWNIKHTAILEFDFAIFKDKKLLGLIEFDGIQHYQPIFPPNGTEEEKLAQFKIIKENDLLKDNYCKERGIKLERISYHNRDKKKLEPLLNNILNKFNDYLGRE